MFMRRRPLLRAGMLAGTAAAAHHAGARSAERQYAESEQDQRLAALEAQRSAPPPPAAPPAAGGTDLVAELTKLKGLADAGVLTPEEFQAAKAKLLAG
jgi:Short C-terminal domain